MKPVLVGDARLVQSIAAHRGRLLLAAGVSAGYATEVFFQPDVFGQFGVAAVLATAGSVFLECALASLAMITAVALVERRAAKRGVLYSAQLLAATAAGALLGVAAWALLTDQPVSAIAAPYLLGEVLRLAVLGAFVALVHGIGQRLQAARAKAHEVALEQAELAAETELSHLRLLEAQIEPHFLFNTIANVRRTWHVDRSLAHRMHDNAIRYLEASLPRMRAAASTLRDEVDLTHAYLDLLAIRMGPRLRFAIDLPPRLAGHAFPRMAVLTLVENSIKHGLMPSDEGGHIAVSAWLDNSDLVVEVRDDGVGFGGADTGGTGIGLANVRARLTAQYGRRGRLEISSAEQGGVVASIRIPTDTDLAAALQAPDEAKAAAA